MDRAQERHRTDLIYFGNLVSACVLRGQRRVDGVEALDAIDQSQK